jgi:hypothetical protein
MARKRVSSTDLIWMIHERLSAFADYPLHGIPVAVVPLKGGDWTALTTRLIKKHRRMWADRVQAIEKQLRQQYIVVA